jgi:hypothetical protein
LKKEAGGIARPGPKAGKRHAYAFINIANVYTADPRDTWTSRDSFVLNDPYVIVLHIQADTRDVH